METVTYIATSRQMALKTKVDVIANNIANMSTTGYKRQRMVFDEFLVKPHKVNPRNDGPYQMVVDAGTYRQEEQGALQRTSNPLDVALQGEGYFNVETANGIRFTRAGNFALNDQRELVTQSGLRVLGANGNEIRIPAGASNITITADGTVDTDAGQAGRIQVTQFTRPQEMVEEGDGLYSAVEAGVDAEGTTLLQGMLEKSNVQPIVEMTEMIEAMRAYQSVVNILQTDHERQRTANQRLSRVS